VAYLTFDPSTEALENLLYEKVQQIETALNTHLIPLGVTSNDVVFRILKCNTIVSSAPHIEIILKTDNPKVTAIAVVEMLNHVIQEPFEVTRIPVGSWVIEWAYELYAYVNNTRRNWASNYS